MEETQRTTITNGDSTETLQASVVQSTDDPTIYGIVWLNPDGTSIW